MLVWRPQAAGKGYLPVQKGYLPVQRLLCCSGLCCTSSPTSKQVRLVLSPRFVCSEHYRVQGLLEEGRERAVLSFLGGRLRVIICAFIFIFIFLLRLWMVLSLFLQIWKMVSVQLIQPIVLQKHCWKIGFVCMWKRDRLWRIWGKPNESQKCRYFLNAFNFEFILGMDKLYNFCFLQKEFFLFLSRSH